MSYGDKIVLASIIDIKNFLEIDPVDTRFDYLIGLILSGVSSKIESFLNRHLLKKERIEYFNSGKSKLYVSAFPIDLNQTISVYDDNSILTIDSDFVVWDDTGVIELTYIIPTTRPRQISVVYTGGFDSIGTISIRNKTYDILDVPDAIAIATVRQVAYEFLRRKELGISSFSTPEGSVSVNYSDLLPDVKNTLVLFRKKPSER